MLLLIKVFVLRIGLFLGENLLSGENLRVKFGEIRCTSGLIALILSFLLSYERLNGDNLAFVVISDVLPLLIEVLILLRFLRAR